MKEEREENLFRKYIMKLEKKILEKISFISNLHLTNKILTLENDIILKSKTDVGIKRKNNEDSVIVLSHPKRTNVKLLAVADGMGGGDYGAIASSLTIETLAKWFLNLSNDELIDETKIKKLLNNKIKEINMRIQNKKIELNSQKGMGTTLSMAVVLDNNTIIANIGDSRTYTIKDDQLKQITEDDAISWYKYKTGLITKDEIRFDSQNYIITRVLGTDGNASFYTVSNNSYDKLLIFSDGITDVLNDDKIRLISKNTDKEKIIDEIINEAVNINHYDGTENGKDNASAVVYIKK